MVMLPMTTTKKPADFAAGVLSDSDEVKIRTRPVAEWHGYGDDAARR
jgi:hypothetical protein